MARVLIVDGNDKSRENLAEMLREEHFIETAPDERTSIFLLLAETWDVVVMDPTHAQVGGVAIMRHITEECATRPEVVVVTHQADLASVIGTLRAGAFEFVPRPLDAAALKKAVANAAQLRAFQQEKRRLEQENRERRARLQEMAKKRTHQVKELFANVPAMLFRLASEPGGELAPTFVSPHCEQVLGVSADQLMSEPESFSSLIHPEDQDRFRAELEYAEAHSERLHFEGRFVLPSGMTRWYQCVCQPVRDADGVVCWDGLLLDVSERNELQTQLVLADRLATVGTLSASVAHEVNNPLAYVYSSLSELREGIAAFGDKELTNLADDALEGLQRIDRTVRDLRTFARSSSHAEGAVRIIDVLDASARLASNEIRHRAVLEKQYGADVKVLADESNLGQVFLNLLVTSAQSIPEGDAQSHRIVIEVVVDELERVRIQIWDNGPGLEETLLRRAFDALPAGHSLRAGMGLYVCRRIVAELGGQISANRRDHGGNHFTVTLPIMPDSSRERARPLLRVLPDRPARVLVVDDEDLVVTALVRALDGHQVTCARSGREAIELLGTSGPFDLVLCDVMMPDMTGADVYKAARGFEPGAEGRIVFVTGGAFTPAARDFLDRVPNRRITKPFSREGVRALVDKMRL